MKVLEEKTDLTEV